ncbi:hypothetical protein Tco_1367116 [Tanacetum coccineum]
MASLEQSECMGCGQPCVGFYCYLCTCQQCGFSLSNGTCINCTYGDGKPVTCCECESPLNGGFCLFCNSRAGNSFTYDSTPNSFDNPPNFSYPPPQPLYDTYFCELCGNDAHYGYDCPPQVPFFLVIHQPRQETSAEMLHAREDLMESRQNFLKRFDRIYFRETSKVLTQAWDKFFEVKHAQSEEVQELLSKLVQDLQSINEELVEYINTPSWNLPTSFYDDDEEYTFAITPNLST